MKCSEPGCVQLTQVATTRSPLQESIHQSLADLNPELADLYEGARCILAEDQPIPGWPRFVPHAIREILRSLQQTLGNVTESRIEYVDRLDKIARVWEGEGLPYEGFGLAGRDQIAAAPSVDLLELIASLLQENRERTTQRERMRQLVDSQAPEAQPEVAIRWARQLSSVYGWAQERAHQPVPGSNAPDLDEYRAALGKFESAIAGLLAEYGPNKGALDDLLAETNRRAD